MLFYLNIAYVLLAIAMIVLILMQRGVGAQAGSGFGGGASGTVFGARGSSSFLSKATKWMAVAFFALSMLMAYQATNLTRPQPGAAPGGLGVMSTVPTAPVQDGSTAVPGVPAAAPSPVPQSPASVPAVPAPQTTPSQAAPAMPVPPPPTPQQTPPTGG